jgi:hypothetical protein
MSEIETSGHLTVRKWFFFLVINNSGYVNGDKKNAGQWRGTLIDLLFGGELEGIGLHRDTMKRLQISFPGWLTLSNHCNWSRDLKRAERRN